VSDALTYDVDLGGHVQHLVTVTLHVPADLADHARLVLPTWTPGSYVERNYARHVQQVHATDADGTQVRVTLDGHTAWRLPAGTSTDVDVIFELYANELTVRTNHVDDHHALLVGAATFPFVDGATDRPHHVRVAAPDGWRVWSLLAGDENGDYRAEDYHHLVDSAFEAGEHAEVGFEVSGVEHRFVWTAHGGRPDLDRLREEAQAVCSTAVELMGGDLPVERYTFLCTGWDRAGGGGGLEHRDGSVLMMPVTIWGAEQDRYAGFLSLIAHEYFHLWNAKRLTPRALVQPDYEHPTHTESLWVAEGWTTYVDHLVPVRAGVWDVDRFLDRQGKLAIELRESPGRRLQSARRASHEAWTKLYVRDENSVNAGVSYYRLGHYLAWCLDLELRRRDPQGDGLDAVLRLLWERHAGDSAGYTEDDVQEAVAEVAGQRMDDFFQAHVGGTELPDVDPLLDVVGLRWKDDEPDDPAPPWLGVQTSDDDQGVTCTSVLRDGPAWSAGVTGGDRLVAIDGLRVARDEFTAVLRPYQPGDTVQVTVFRGPRLLTLPVTLGEPVPAPKLVRTDEPTDAQRDAFERWLGRPFAVDDDADGEHDGA